MTPLLVVSIVMDLALITNKEVCARNVCFIFSMCLLRVYREGADIFELGTFKPSRRRSGRATFRTVALTISVVLKKQMT